MSFRNTLKAGAFVLLGLLGSANAKDEHFNHRQLNTTAIYTHNDSIDNGRVFVHGMRDGSDAFVEFSNDKDNTNLKGYLDFKKKYLLGEFKALYSGNKWNKDNNNKYHSNLINLEHTVVNHPWFRNSIGLEWSERVDHLFEEDFLDTAGVDTSLGYDLFYNIFQDDKSFSNHNKKTEIIKVKQKLTDYLKLEYNKKNINETIKDSSHTLENQIISIPIYSYNDTTSSIFEVPKNNHIDIKINEFITIGNLPFLKVIANLNNYEIKNKEVSKRDSKVASNDSLYKTINYGFDKERDLTKKSLISKHENNLGIKIIHLVSEIKGSGRDSHINTEWVPDTGYSNSNTRSIINAGNIMYVKSWVHNLHFKTDNFSHENKGDTTETVFGFNSYTGAKFVPILAHENTKSREFGYDLVIPFSEWDSERIASDLMWRRFEQILEDQEDKSLRINQNRENQFNSSAIPKFKLSLKYKLEFDSPRGQHHNSKTFNLGLQHAVINKPNLKVMPFYNLEYLLKTSSYEDSSLIVVEPNKFIKQSHEIGFYVYLPKQFALLVGSAKWNHKKTLYETADTKRLPGWEFKLGFQKVFTPMKSEWFD